MPKFVSGSSGYIYGPHKSSSKGHKAEEEEISSLVTNESGRQKDDSGKKPSAINKKGTKEKQKNSLDLFKEELRRLNEERDEQRNRVRKSIDDKTSGTNTSSGVTKSQPVPVPLKPDPRCPTTLTLQVNLNPKDRDSSMSGSFDTGDPTTTNLYIGNINPTVNENDLCDIFGKFGPLASIKIMWPRTIEEKARNRNSGFVAYMSRIDAERALKSLNGMEFRNYDMKLGWGKAVPLPQNPVYIPPELLETTLPPAQSGLPFNAQLHQSDIERAYSVPNPYPTPLPAELESQIDINPELKSIKETYEEFIGVVKRSTVTVVMPHDRSVLDRIHKMVECVIKEGPVFESVIVARESNNPEYRFMYDYQCQEHVYYRWKLYSILHGDDPYKWRTEEFRMFEDGPLWRPPPLNPYADGMPIELVEKMTGISKEVLTSNDSSKINTKRPLFLEGSNMILTNDTSRTKGQFDAAKREILGDILRNLDCTRTKIGSAMMFCINHSDAAQEIIDCIYESLLLLETPFQRKVARLFLVSDILHNCSAAVTNASYYRKGFQAKLVSIFEHLREYLINIEDRQKADKFKQKTLSVLGAWREWTLYEDELVIELSNILLGISSKKTGDTKHVPESHLSHTATASDAAHVQALDECDAGQLFDDNKSSESKRQPEEQTELDGEPLDDATLAKCLEAKGLSLRWYKTLELSDDEEEDRPVDDESRGRYDTTRSPSSARSGSSVARDKSGSSQQQQAQQVDRVRFKTSKWETVDPNEVAEQVVTLSKWDTIVQEAAKESRFGSDGSSTSCDEDQETTTRARPVMKRFKRTTEAESSSDNSSMTD